MRCAAAAAAAAAQGHSFLIRRQLKGSHVTPMCKLTINGLTRSKIGLL